MPCPSHAMIAVGMTVGIQMVRRNTLILPDETVVTAGVVGLVCRTFCMLYEVLDVTVV